MNLPPPTKQQVYRKLADRLDRHASNGYRGLLPSEDMKDAAAALRDAAAMLDSVEQDT